MSLATLPMSFAVPCPNPACHEYQDKHRGEPLPTCPTCDGTNDCTVKPNQLNKLDLVAGVQEGGSSVEAYCYMFDNEEDFWDGVREWDEASYSSYGPFPVTIGDEQSVLEMAGAIARAVATGDYANDRIPE